MIQGFSIKDDKAGLFMQPFFQKNVVQAMRSIQGAATDPTSQLAQFPADFSVHRICDFDEETGIIHNAEPVQLCTIQSIIERQQNGDKK